MASESPWAISGVKNHYKPLNQPTNQLQLVKYPELSLESRITTIYQKDRVVFMAQEY